MPPKAKASKPAAAPKAKASTSVAAPLACVASVLQDEDLMAIVLEQGGLSIMAATTLSKSSV